MVIDGIGVWGADAIVGKDDGGMSEGDSDYRLICCVPLGTRSGARYSLISM